MELKLSVSKCYLKKDVGFNRTFMELKRCRKQTCHTAHKCFNRTFMELKLSIEVERSTEVVF